MLALYTASDNISDYVSCTKLRVLLAFLVILSKCCPHSNLLLNVIPFSMLYFLKSHTGEIV